MPCVISRSTILRSLVWHCKELVWNLLPSSEVYATYIVIDCVSGMQVLDEFYSSVYCLRPCTLRSTQLSVTFLWKSIIRTGRSLCVFCLPWYLSGVPQNSVRCSETQNWQIDAHTQCCWNHQYSHIPVF